MQILKVNKKEIEFLQDLEIKIFKLKNKSIITENDYNEFYKIVDKLKMTRIKRNKKSRDMIREKRKYNKNYAR